MSWKKFASLAALSLVAACAAGPMAPVQQAGLDPSDWPAHRSPTPVDQAMETRIANIVAGMTLEQKIGQITQPDIRWITLDEVAQYYIGSVLNGGGAWPNNNKRSTVQDWANQSAAYHAAAMRSDMAVKIPLIWGTDAVHGHSNVSGATLFPHNIGLGAANDPALVERIGRATAQQVRATGITWVFAPTVAVGENRRWGRSYESYSSDPALVGRYGAALVRGLQGRLTGDGDVVATAKHFLGDGGTFNGVDQGENRATRAHMIAVHGAGYYAALDAGVQTVMASYNSWNDVAAGRDYGKMHGSRELLTDVLKGRLGFDGLVVSDWNGIEQVPGCTKDHCPQAINAGIDVVMVPEDWKAFIANTVADVRAGRIAESRIDDAVTRILRVKMRSGLFQHQPAESRINGQASALDVRALAREAVRKSVVLLKNDNAALPLRAGQRVLVVGSSADSLSNQTGGWSLTWQGTENVNADFATGQTLLAALREQLGEANVTYSVDGRGVDPSQFSAVVAVLGETPYAEYNGDVRFPAPLQHSTLHPADLAALQAVAGKGAPVVTVFYSGRPAYTNDLMNLSDAFVAAFLPGTEASGLADVMLGGRYDFTGRLSFAWPGSACSTGEDGVVQFARGYGLGYAQARSVGALPTPATPMTCPVG
ncbi:1,4-beta-D-glucan glucohydrolase [Brevundimonas sp. Leaf363]|uniref:glycoside hydrolase family 3 protein n=1 Tax=Brevundimonas sp. Leaf363 TaxID=1736353 RepID=UPI0006F77A90|nr:glycoside hydrolase family 3 protein [Brevundimonas sp. Leaf363]KQS53885.1 1,4-beta-D-glucan glucohydrolase [Brevundimonas sp. Leaf363]